MNTHESSLSDGNQAPETMPGNGTEERKNSQSSPDALPGRQMSEAEKASAVASLLAGETGQGEDGPPGGAEEGQEAGIAGADGERGGLVDHSDSGGDGAPDVDGHFAADGGLTPQAIAEGLGVEAAEVYDMDIPLGDDGETVKLGALKDAWQDRATAERESAEREAGLNEREAAIISDQQAWAMLAAEGQLTPKVFERVRERIGERMNQEQGLLFDLVPELRDETKLDLFRRDLVRVMGQVGYQPHEVVLGDHRQGLLLRRFVQLEKENAAMKKQLRPKPPRTPKPQGRGKPAKPNFSAARRGNDSQKVAAVSQLLNGKG